MKLDRADRGASPTIGIVLLFGMVFVGATIVALSGMMAIDAVESQSNEERAEQSLEQLDRDLTTLQFTGGDGRTELPFEEGDDVRTEERGTISFELNPESKTVNKSRAHENATEVPLKTIVYEKDGHVFGYQSGAVWKETDDGTTMVSEPRLSYDTTTVDGETVWLLDASILDVEAEGSGPGSTAAYDPQGSRAESQALQEALSPEANDVSQVTSVMIQIEDSPYQDGWKRYFEQEFDHPDATVRTDGDTLIAEVPVGPDDRETLPEDIEKPGEAYLATYGAFVTTTETLELQNGQIKSYDSGEGPHAATETEDGKVVALGNVHLQTPNSGIFGDVFADGDVTGNNNAEIDGNASVNGTVKDVTVTGSIDDDWEPDDDHEPGDVTEYVGDVIEYAEESNDNDETAAIDGGEIESGPQTLDSGVYHLESGDLTGDLTLDVTDGDMVVAVDDDLTVRSGETIAVVGDNEVRWFVGGDDLRFDGDVRVEDEAGTRTDRSTSHWIFGTEDARTSINDVLFTGVVYTSGGEISAENGATVLGALVGDATVEGNNVHTDFYYDQALDEYGTEPDLSAGAGNGTVGGFDESNLESLDWKVTLVDTELAGLDESGSSFSIDLPVETVDNPDDDLDSLEYWQRAGSEADERVETEEFSGTVEDGDDTVTVGIVDDAGRYGGDVKTVLDARLPSEYETETVDSSDPVTDDPKDVYVVQHVDEANGSDDPMADFVDATDGDDVGVVYLHQYQDPDESGESNAIDRFSDATDDPESTTEYYQEYDNPVRYEVQRDNPIVDGWSAGDSIEIHDSVDADQTWFSDHSFDVIAEVADDYSTSGDALAIDEDSNTVLASSLGRTTYLRNSAYTNEADEVLANSVEYVAPDETGDGTETFEGSAYEEVVVTVDLDKGNNADRLTLSASDGTEVASAENADTLEADLPADDTYEVDVETKQDGVDYDLTVETIGYAESVTFDATEHDEVTIDLESDAAAFDVVDPAGDTIVSSTGSGDVSETFWVDDGSEPVGGEYTIEVYSTDAEAEDYDLTLKRTEVKDAARYTQAPINASLLFDHDDGSDPDVYDPWPETDLEAQSDEDPYWPDDNVNHPANDHPMTFEISDVEPSTELSAEIAYYNYAELGHEDSYAGTTRTHDGTTYFEVGDTVPTEDTKTINVLEEDTERIKILEDGDEVPDIGPAEAQRSMQDMLGDKLVYDDEDDVYRMNLDELEFAAVFELADIDDDHDHCPGEPTWECALETGADAPDYNDVVMLFEITDMELSEEPDGGIDEGGSRSDGPSGMDVEDYGYTIDISNDVITLEEDE